MSAILLVEDDTSLGPVLEERLSQEGYSVTLAVTRAEAERIFKNQSFDVVLLDIGLPDGSGFAFARIVKESRQSSLIFLTAMNSAEYRLEGFEIGADDYIPKPFHLKELLLRIRKVIEKKITKRVLELGSITIDFNSRSIIRANGQSIFPQTRDFDILELLIDQAPRPLSREEIFERLWPKEAQSIKFRSIDNAVVRLRTIFKEAMPELEEAEAFIRSVRGIGYQWIVESGKG